MSKENNDAGVTPVSSPRFARRIFERVQVRLSEVTRLLCEMPRRLQICPTLKGYAFLEYYRTLERLGRTTGDQGLTFSLKLTNSQSQPFSQWTPSTQSVARRLIQNVALATDTSHSACQFTLILPYISPSGKDFL
ncbi:hypothetical protein SKAU_G00179360 [Synaphobranchus kaupii]|uniref:Uncharacterized protein n=1 Tax=Synaphobranchus kaupii TaxID=118154 RepID=A0A9Q1J0K8_SYNKA|nr:hypothetical protein SKAU_G00179360 [Synaphobranchus kaupii]